MEARRILIGLRERDDLQLSEWLRVDHGVGRTAGFAESVREIDRRVAGEVGVAEVSLRRRLHAIRLWRARAFRGGAGRTRRRRDAGIGRSDQIHVDVRGGLLGIYDPRVVQTALKNLHGWQDQPARKVAVAQVSKEELERRFGDRMAASRARMQEVLEERADLLHDARGA